jgi:NIMA (never in mitosis gene a)-related kinase 9
MSYNIDIEQNSIVDETYDDTNLNKNRIPYQIYQRSSNSFLQSNDPQEDLQEDLYVFVKFLGRGSFGSVNLYRHTNENILVAWKEIDLNILESPLQNEINSEICILASLDHPNIIAYYKHFIGDNCLYIELEYANGATLMHMIKQQKSLNQNFPEETVMWYVYQIISAVDYIHDQQILHRDIKSLNIFSTKAGLLKLGDFGLAKRLDAFGLANSVLNLFIFIC